MNPVIRYFNGEKAESYLFILFGLVAFAMALYFIFALKSTFWRGAAIPFLLVACLEITVGFTIVKRSPLDLNRVETALAEAPQSIQTFEIPRMEKVMSNFVLFRYTEIILIILGMMLMYSSMHDTFWRGLGLGLFIQAGTVLCLDFFAERRGTVYLDYLKSLLLTT